MKTRLNNLRVISSEFLIRIYLRLGTTLLVGLALAMGALLFFAWLANEMMAGQTKEFDETIRSTVHQIANPALTTVMLAASFIGSTLFLVTLGAIVFFVFWFLKRTRAAILFAVTTLGSILLLVTLKLSFGRARPEPFFDALPPASYSFPSGHALAALCFYGTLAAIITARLQNRLAGFAIWTFAIFLTAIIGFSRIYLGVHYPSDVAAGYAAALVWVVAIALGDRFFLQPQKV